MSSLTGLNMSNMTTSNYSNNKETKKSKSSETIALDKAKATITDEETTTSEETSTSDVIEISNPYENKFSTHENYYEESYVADSSYSSSSSSSVSEKDTDYLIAQAEEQARQFSNFMNKSLNNQSKNDLLANSSSNSTYFGSDYSSNFYTTDLKSSVLALKLGLEDGSITVSQANIDEAQSLTSENGYYGAKQTSERILDFAKTISGGDTSQAEVLRDAVDEAFEDVADMWGGMENTPQVTQDTYDLVMQGFDDWVNGVASDSE